MSDQISDESVNSSNKCFEIANRLSHEDPKRLSLKGSHWEALYDRDSIKRPIKFYENNILRNFRVLKSGGFEATESVVQISYIHRVGGTM